MNMVVSSLGGADELDLIEVSTQQLNERNAMHRYYDWNARANSLDWLSPLNCEKRQVSGSVDEQR